MQGQDGVTSCI